MRALVIAIVCLGSASIAFADPPAPTKRPHTAPALEALSAARNKGKAPAKAAPTAETTPSTAAAPEAPPPQQNAAVIALKAAARRAKRDMDRRDRHKQLRAKLKAKDTPAPLRVELRNHARRISRLQRIRALAEGDAALIARVDALMTRENDRHARRVETLIARANQNAPREDREQDDEVEE